MWLVFDRTLSESISYQLVVVDVHQVLEGPPLYPVEGHRGHAVVFLKVRLQSKLGVEILRGSAMGTYERRLPLYIVFTVDLAFMGGSTRLRVEDPFTSGVTTPIIHHPIPLPDFEGGRKYVFAYQGSNIGKKGGARTLRRIAWKEGERDIKRLYIGACDSVAY